MCRLFGVRSTAASSVSRALVQGSNSLAAQSLKHPDGWGIAHFSSAGEVRAWRGLEPAHASARFARIANRVVSTAVVAHVRKASVGGLTLTNTHPFTHDGWVFAHNGTLRGFDSRRGALERCIAPSLRAHLRGETDSERCFLAFLTELGRHRGTDRADCAARALAAICALALRGHPPGEPEPTSATFLATDGAILVGIRAGRELCFAAPEARRQRRVRAGAQLNRLVVASEPLDGGQGWVRMRERSLVAMDEGFRLRRYRLESLIS